MKLVESPQAASEAAAAMLGMQLVATSSPRVSPVHTVLVEKAGSIARELYVSLLTYWATESVVFMASAAGGMDKEVAASTPEKIITVTVPPAQGFFVLSGAATGFRHGPRRACNCSSWP